MFDEEEPQETLITVKLTNRQSQWSVGEGGVREIHISSSEQLSVV